MQQPDHRRHQHHRRNNPIGANKFGRPKQPQAPVIIHPGQTSFRLLCHVFTIGGVIGHSGSVVKQLEQETAAKISVYDSVPDCVERVIVVVGTESPKKRIALKGEDNEGGEVVCDVSNAQEGLIRVFERALAVEAEREGETAGASCCCRLLTYMGQIGAIVRRGGRIIDKIREDSGAKIRILREEQLPACASPGDELIHITGGVFAVKRALVAFSHFLQDCPPFNKAPMVVSRPVETAPYVTFPDPHASFPGPHATFPDPHAVFPVPHATFPDPHAEFFPHLSSLSPSLPGNSANYTSSGHSLSTDVDGIPGMDAKDSQLEVVLRLLCSTGTVGGVIGKGGTIVRTLQNESGASINVEGPVAKCNERVVSISTLENPESLYSPAQNAALRVFARSVEVGIEKGLITDSSKGHIVTARLLIAPNQADCFTGEGACVVSEIVEATGADIQFFRGDELPDCALENDEVVQITGEYKNVQNALFQVTGRLRDNYFPSKVLKGAGARSYSSPAIPDINPFGRWRETASPVLHQSLGHSPNFNQETLRWGMNNLSLSHNFGGRPPSRFQLSKTLGRGNITSSADGRSGKRGLEFGSGSNYAVTNTTVEVVLPEHVFSSVYGEDGSNLARVRQISGAKVELRDPSRGKSERIVVISGAPDQTKAAQSLLQAFILAGQ
ncbi:hypothetical protein L1049_012968 [Liquidambar formosana]|uniref:K Homology domain-containing protein n=1 Tax=Liquidambar formosana TaxID=63359 RepID=A0AAP0RM71_LIQFO